MTGSSRGGTGARFLFGLILAASSVATLQACRESTNERANLDLLRLSGRDLLAGTTARDLATDPATTFGPEGQLVHHTETTRISFFFEPRRDGQQPKPGARLMGVEAQREFKDPARAWATWTEEFGELADSLGETATCEKQLGHRILRLTASFDGPPRILYSLSVLRSEDGSDRVSTITYLSAVMAGPWSQPATQGSQSCSSLTVIEDSDSFP